MFAVIYAHFLQPEESARWCTAGFCGGSSKRKNSVLLGSPFSDGLAMIFLVPCRYSGGKPPAYPKKLTGVNFEERSFVLNASSN